MFKYEGTGNRYYLHGMPEDGHNKPQGNVCTLDQCFPTRVLQNILGVPPEFMESINKNGEIL